MVLLGEIIGTAILIFIGCLSCVGSMGIVPPLYQISMSFGIAVTIAIQVFLQISVRKIFSFQLLFPQCNYLLQTIQKEKKQNCVFNVFHIDTLLININYLLLINISILQNCLFFFFFLRSISFFSSFYFVFFVHSASVT